jgi:hypothetical protein
LTNQFRFAGDNSSLIATKLVLISLDIGVFSVDDQGVDNLVVPSAPAKITIDPKIFEKLGTR